eukprot:91101-Rhodomonas_salina.2
MKNPVLSFNDSLRKDLNRWMCEWISRIEENNGVCLALGTSLCGMSADELARTAGKSGLVIIGLAPTAFDEICAVRIWGMLDQVLVKLAQRRGRPAARAHALCAYCVPRSGCRAPSRELREQEPGCSR